MSWPIPSSGGKEKRDSVRARSALELDRLFPGEQLTNSSSFKVILVKHTGCGMLTFTNDDAHALVKQNLGPAAAAELGTLDFLPFSDLDDAVKEDVGFLKKSTTVPEDVKISGWVYEVETGRVRQVV